MKTFKQFLIEASDDYYVDVSDLGKDILKNAEILDDQLSKDKDIQKFIKNAYSKPIYDRPSYTLDRKFHNILTDIHGSVPHISIYVPTVTYVPGVQNHPLNGYVQINTIDIPLPLTNKKAILRFNENTQQKVQEIPIFFDEYFKILKRSNLSKRFNKYMRYAKDDTSYYIRFGKIPEDERSKNFITGEKEKGVSAYYAYYDVDDDKWVAEYSDENPATYDDIKNRVKESRGDIFLITGKEVGYGSDDEPLLKNVKVIKKLDPKKDVRYEDL